MKRTVICPKCRKTNVGSISQCLICKTPLPLNTEVTVISQIGIKPGLKCPSCGMECLAESRFCIRCGAALAKTRREEPLSANRAVKCPGCGQMMINNPNYCIRCGMKLN